MSLKHTILLHPSNGQSFDNSAAVMAAFYEGRYFHEIMPNGDLGRMWITIDDIDSGDVVKVTYLRHVGDFAFGDHYEIDRTFSVMFRAVKDIEELHEEGTLT